jgi:hypothetical protein
LIFEREVNTLERYAVELKGLGFFHVNVKELAYFGCLELITFRVKGKEWRLHDVLKFAYVEGGVSAVENSISPLL